MPPGPPPPPPAPTRQGGGGGGGAPPFIQVNGGGGPPRPEMRPQGPPPPPPGFQPPLRPPIQSTRVVDITPRRPLDEDACRKKLTNYEAYTIRKIAPRDSKDKPTWAKSEITKEPLSQEDISWAVRKLNESKRSVQDKKSALMQFQQGQVNRLMDELMSGELDPNFESSLAQLEQKTFTNKKGQKETSTITVYVKRALLKDVSAIAIFNLIERNKQARFEQMNRPPPPRPDPTREPQIVNLNGGGGNGGGGNGGGGNGGKGNGGGGNGGRGNGGGGNGGGGNGGGGNGGGGNGGGNGGRGNGGGGNNGGGNGGGRGGHNVRGGRLKRPKKYYDNSSVSSDYSSSESESDSEYTSDGDTTISTHSGRRSKRYGRKGRSHSRRREHRRKYYVDDRILSPEPRYRDALPLGTVPRYVPEAPIRTLPAALPAFDPVAAAYQAGKIDADAERFGVDRFPRRSIPEPAAIVSYGRPLDRVERLERLERTYEPPSRYADEARYLDRHEERRYIDDRDDEYLRRERDDRRRREAEEYMERRFSDPRLEHRDIYTDPNPFAPMRSPRRYSYTPSLSTRDDYRR